MILRTRTFFLLNSLLIVLAGCGSDEPTSEDYDDIASGLAPVVATNVQANVELAVELATGATPLSVSVEADGSYGGSYGGLDVQVALSCTDAGGESLAICDESTDAASVEGSFSGDLEIGGWSGNLGATAEWQIAGLTSDTVRATGSAAVHAESDFQSLLTSIERSYMLDVDAEYDLTLDRATLVPTSGSASASVQASRFASSSRSTSEAEFSVDAELTFEGNTAVLVLDGSATYRLDLDAGTASRM